MVEHRRDLLLVAWRRQHSGRHQPGQVWNRLRQFEYRPAAGHRRIGGGGKTDAGAERLKNDALALQAAGAALVLLEAVPAALGKETTELLQVPTIGIGAGADCSGQVLVMHDMLGVFPGHKAKFVKNFMEGQTSIEGAVRAYVGGVKDGSFPAQEHCF